MNCSTFKLALGAISGQFEFFFYSSSALTFPQIELFAIRIEVWIEFDRLKPLLEFKSINRIK